MNFLIWLLKWFGLNSWAAAIETKILVDRQEAEKYESEVAQEVENEKQDVVDTPNDSLDNLLDELWDDAKTRANSNSR